MRGIKTFCLKHKEIYPNTNIIAYIREYALDDPKELIAEEAWGELRNEQSRVGGIYGSPNFDDETLRKTVKIMGWRNLCLSTNEEADRAHFMKIFSALKVRSRN